MQKDSYSLIDSGNGKKLERFGPYLISRPSPQAVWLPSLPEEEWKKADAVFTRSPSGNRWRMKNSLPSSWNIRMAHLTLKISPTDFGHLGIFPEQLPFWQWLQKAIKKRASNRKKAVSVLNLFAYSGGATLAAAASGANVCHLDASKGMVSWARENAFFSGLNNAPIRWIVEDVQKFLKREIKRQKTYDAIILDPPSFGRGSKGEVFRIEKDLLPLLTSCKELLSNTPLFFLFSCHTHGFTPIAMHHLMSQTMHDTKGHIDAGEMTIRGEKKTFDLPSGIYVRWFHEG